MRLNIGYKLAENKNGKWTSVNCVKTKKTQLTYKLNETTTPICGKLFIFKTLKEAEEYKDSFFEHREFAIFQGIAQNKKESALTFSLGWTGMVNNLCEFWTKVNSGTIITRNDVERYFYSSCALPKKTWLCDTFKPLKRIA